MNSMEDRITDPGVIRIKLNQEIKNLRDARRADRIEFMEESQRKTREYNELAAAHNEMVEIADREAKKSAFRGMLLSATITHSAMMMATAAIDGTISLQAVVLTTLLSACVAGIHHTLTSSSIWDDGDEAV
jgi:hypothetical protein